MIAGPLDGTLLSIERVGMVSGYDRGFHSGKHKRHGLNVQVIADSAGRPVWASPALPGARHDLVALVRAGALRQRQLVERPDAYPNPKRPEKISTHRFWLDGPRSTAGA